MKHNIRVRPPSTKSVAAVELLCITAVGGVGGCTQFCSFSSIPDSVESYKSDFLPVVRNYFSRY